ncbi:MAG: MotA/TolQ/ExbB proton channel family protein [Bacteroidales bacterium]|nr:MotA/TolQ/ExbB proton channel family protein [Bacteroidales bacterium]MBP5395855.1 MotA/TolQ/ExbB proton channel family protein [Bacteroidales bacterium]MBP5612731.1 MotA/TolQ/ExbB proton channel family protein [Bacteroidales bacterium]
MHYISDILYWISTGLLVPVILLLIYFFCRSLLMVGGFFGQYLDTRRTHLRTQEHLRTLTPDNLDDFWAELPAKSRSLFMRHLKELQQSEGSPARIEKVVADFEAAADKELTPSKMLAKMGPMFGLMGTLIPMGPALVGLSTGDIASMAYNMQVAFATTVVGLFSSAVGFAVQQIKRRWYVEEMNQLVFVAELLKEKHSGQ